MKKLATLTVALLFLFSLTACTKSTTSGNASSTGGTTASGEQTANPAHSNTEKDADNFTPFTEKKGSWRMNIISGNTISVVKVSVNGEDGDLLCLRGAPYDSYEKSLTEQRPEDSETINGIKYWYEVGDSCYLTFAVSDNTVTFLSDEFDMEFTFTRIDENNMKVTSANNIPPRFHELETGCQFTFEAE